MSRPRRHLLYLLFWLLPGAPGQAHAQADTTVALPEVTIEDTRDRNAPATAAGRLTRLEAADLEAAGARTLADALEARTGLFVRRYGSGGLATLSLRGTGGAHTPILLDGLRVADPQTGQVDLSLLPTVLLETVEVFHGAAAHTADGLGGVVRLGTLRADGPGRIKVSGAYGAYGERTLGAVAAGGRRRLSGVASVEVSRAEGDFLYRNETLVPPRDVRRTGADRSLLTLFGRAAYRGGRHRAAVAGWLNRAERGLPGPGNAPPGGARQWDHHLRLWAGSETRFAWGSLDLKGMVQRTRLRYANPHAATDDTARTRSFDVEAQAHAAGRRWLAVGGLAAGFDHGDLRGGVRQTRLGAFLHGTGAYGRWRLYPALRLDVYRTAGTTTLALSPTLGVNVQPFAGQELQLKGSVGRAFRAPTFNERFWQPGGNPDLKPERGWRADAGILARAGRGTSSGEAEVSFFLTRLRDQIAWFPGFVDPTVQVWRPANLRRVVTRGVEASLRGQGRPLEPLALDGGLAYTFTEAEDRSDPAAASYGRQLRHVPRQQLKLFAGAAWGALRLDLSGRLVGRRALTTDASMYLPAYRVFDAQLRYRYGRGKTTATLALFVENLFDYRYAVVRFYPMPPRHAGARLTLDFHP